MRFRIFLQIPHFPALFMIYLIFPALFGVFPYIIAYFQGYCTVLKSFVTNIYHVQNAIVVPKFHKSCKMSKFAI